MSDFRVEQTMRDGVPEPDWRTCGACVHLLEDCCDYGVCSLELKQAEDAGELSGESGRVDPARVIEWAAAHHVDMQSETCPRFRAWDAA